ncbi:MAG: hypothetical protein CL843_09350 [Crocinitomicaceae bacterium]|nr:hypothetical protein [Crocinitomicaceae bacterium]
MVEKKTWPEFRSTGLVLIINQLLHVFGWSIVFEIENDEVRSVYPARVKFRGFDNKTTSYNYQKVSEYLKEHAKELHNEVKDHI